MNREHDESGKFTEQITEERVLEVLGEGNVSGFALSAKQVSEKLDCSRQAADRKLRELEQEGKVLKHELGPRSVAWSRRRVRRSPE